MTSNKELVALLAVCCAGAGSCSRTDERPARPGAAVGGVARGLSDVELEPETLGPGWRKLPGVVIDSWDDVDSLDEATRSAAALLQQQFAAHGVVGVADYSLTRTSMPLDTVTVRVLEFGSEPACRVWKETRYVGGPVAERLVRVPATTGKCDVFDIQGANRRVVFAGKRFLTSHHIQPGEAHVAALRAVAAQLGIEL